MLAKSSRVLEFLVPQKTSVRSGGDKKCLAQVKSPSHPSVPLTISSCESCSYEHNPSRCN